MFLAPVVDDVLDAPGSTIVPPSTKITLQHLAHQLRIQRRRGLIVEA